MRQRLDAHGLDHVLSAGPAPRTRARTTGSSASPITPAGDSAFSVIAWRMCSGFETVVAAQVDRSPVVIDRVPAEAVIGHPHLDRAPRRFEGAVVDPVGVDLAAQHHQGSSPSLTTRTGCVDPRGITIMSAGKALVLPRRARFVVLTT